VITTRVSVQIDRPVEEVFAFVAKPANFLRWAGALVASTTFRQVNKLMGRRFVSEMRYPDLQAGRAAARC
jgi:uncharacterized protein YndB with AHSA1/START domain